ncbi:hypothetical protein GGR58DRAFT_486550 [Xylaria digitata]|nr:hypothetical protein GGR58DRAFT_486550 [Xylaria digitata]
MCLCLSSRLSLYLAIWVMTVVSSVSRLLFYCIEFAHQQMEDRTLNMGSPSLWFGQYWWPLLDLTRCDHSNMDCLPQNETDRIRQGCDVSGSMLHVVQG